MQLQPAPNNAASADANIGRAPAPAIRLSEVLWRARVYDAGVELTTKFLT